MQIAVIRLFGMALCMCLCLATGCSASGGPEKVETARNTIAGDEICEPPADRYIDDLEPGPLQHAAVYGDVETVRSLVESGTDVDELDALRMTALMHSAAISLPVMRVLLDLGADPNLISCGDTALTITYIRNSPPDAERLEAARLLIDAGASISIPDGNDRLREPDLCLQAQADSDEAMAAIVCGGA